MGCITSAISMVLFQGEKFSACIAITALLWCLVATLVFTLALGIGLGYNYCFVDIQTKYKYIAPRVRYPPPGYDRHPYYPGYRYPKVKRIKEDRQSTNYPYPYSTFNPDLDQSSDYNGNPYPYPGFVPQRNIEDEEEATLPNLSGDDLDKTTSTVSSVTDNSNKINDTATTINNTLIKGLDINSTRAVKTIDISNTTDVSTTTKVFNTTENITTTEESTEKVDIEDGLPKMSIPISSLDLIGLLTRLRAENKNYTLQIVT